MIRTRSTETARTKGTSSIARSSAVMAAGTLASRILGLVRNAERAIPASMWQDLPPEVLPKYVVMLREARVSIAKQGLYDKTTMNIMKRARCSVNPGDAECATQREIE